MHCKIVVLGSDNMDRASWYTSQELGITLFGEDAVKIVWEGVEDPSDLPASHRQTYPRAGEA